MLSVSNQHSGRSQGEILEPTCPARRGVLAAVLAAGVVQLFTRRARAHPSARITFVLVHSAWHGGWCWKKLVPLLRAPGHEVHTPTLTGLGERSHLGHPQIGLDTHVQDVASLIEYENLKRVVLVGHSSSGAVVTAVADRLPKRIAHVVYLDAFVPEDGQALFDLIPPERRQGMEQRVLAEGEGWLLPSLTPTPWDEFLRDAWQITDARDRRWMLARLAPMPFKAFTDPLSLASGAWEHLSRSYVRCTQWPNATFDRYLATARLSAGWRHHEMHTSHEPFVTHPRELAQVLLDLLG